MISAHLTKLKLKYIKRKRKVEKQLKRKKKDRKAITK
jgi:hypothetical protein